MIATPLLAILLQAAAPVPAGSAGVAPLPGDLPEVTVPAASPAPEGSAVPEEIPLRLSSTDSYGCLWGASNANYCRHPSSYENLDGARTGLPVAIVHSMANPTMFGRSTSLACATAWNWQGAPSGAGCYLMGPWDSDAYRVWAFQQQVAKDFVEQSVGLRHGKELRQQQEAMGTAPRWTSGGEAPHQQSGASAGSSAYQGGGGGGGGAPSAGSSGGSVSKPGRMGLQ